MLRTIAGYLIPAYTGPRARALSIAWIFACMISGLVMAMAAHPLAVGVVGWFGLCVGATVYVAFFMLAGCRFIQSFFPRVAPSETLEEHPGAPSKVVRPRSRRKKGDRWMKHTPPCYCDECAASGQTDSR